MASLEIVFLDDEPMLCEIFEETFSSSDVVVRVFMDHEQAIDFCQNNSPDMIFIDYRMPGKSGDIVVQSIPANTAKYLMTGEIGIESINGFDGVIKKPFNSQLIQNLIDEKLKNKRN